MRKHGFLLLVFVIASFISVTAQPALADPADDLAAVKKAFQSVSSVHIEFKKSQESGSLDMINPSKLHWTLSNGIQVVTIGQQSWMSMGGKWIEQPQQPAMAATMMQRFRSLNLEGADIRKNYIVRDAGTAMADGAPARKYHIVNKHNGHTFDLLVGANRLPVRYIGSDGDTWTFSQYNSVADIKPPM
jgi:hypothetical protein